MPRIITSSKIANIDDKQGLEILDGFSLQDIQNRPEEVFKRYFEGTDEEYQSFLKTNGLQIDYDRHTRDDLLFQLKPYLDRFFDRADRGNFSSTLQEVGTKKKQVVNAKMLLQEVTYDFSEFDKRDWDKFLKEFQYNSSSLLSFMTIDETSQTIKTYAVNKNLIELKDIKEDIESKDNYLKISTNMARSVPKLEPRLDLNGVKARTDGGINQNTVALTEMRAIYTALQNAGLYEVYTQYRNTHDNEIGNAVYFPSNFILPSSLDKKSVEFEVNFSKEEEEKQSPIKHERVESIDKATLPQGGSLNKGEGYKKVEEEDAKKIKVEDKIQASDLQAFEELTSLEEYMKESERIEAENSRVLESHIDSEIENLLKTKELIPEATQYALDAIKKGATVASSLESVKQTYRKFPQLPYYVEDNLRIKFLSIDSKEKLIANMSGRVKELGVEVSNKIKAIEERDTKIASINKELTTRNGEVDKLTTAINELTERYDTLQGDFEAQEALSKELDTLVAKRDATVKELTTSLEELKHERDTLASELKIKQDENSKLKGELQSAESTNETLRKALTNKDSTIETLEKQVQSKNGYIESLEQQNGGYAKQLQSKDDYIASLDKELGNYKGQLADKDTRIQSLEKQVQSLFNVEADNKQLEKVINDLKKANQLLESQKREVEVQAKKLQEQMTQAKPQPNTPKNDLASRIKAIGTIEADIRGTLLIGKGIDTDLISKSYPKQEDREKATQELKSLIQKGYANEVGDKVFVNEDKKETLLANLEKQTSELEEDTQGESQGDKTKEIQTKKRRY